MKEFRLDYISKRRKELGYTLENMANILGITGSPTYLRYERGVYKFKAEMVPRLASALKCKIDDLFA